jgi:transposase-like protein
MPRRYRFTQETKLAAVKRMLGGENVRSLSRELIVTCKTLYEWRAKYLSGGARALRGPGRPRDMMGGDPPPQTLTAVSSLPPHAELVKARARIIELERKVGRQQLELDFFQQALRRVREKRRPSDGPGAEPSTPSSRR